jgi:hypothetical protein
MKKTISGVLLALTAVFALVACGKKKDNTTKQGGDDKKKGTISFYVWNDEFKTRLNELYPEVEKAEASKTTLKNGLVINWVQSPNQSAVYQNSLDVALSNNLVDMFCFEADYATKYVKSDYVADMATLGINQANQYQYTKDIVTNAAGKLVGSSWQGTPGIIAYNTTVAKAVWGDSVTLDDMDKKLSKDKATFDAAAAEVKAKEKFMNIGTDDWFRVYQNNLSAKMWDGTKVTIDKQLFQWAKDTKEYATKGYLASTDDTYGLWGGNWGKEMGKNTTLCVFSCPWFTDFCLTGNVKPDVTDGNYGDLGYKAVKGYQSWFWGGTWLTATKKAADDANLKDTVADIITKMTTDTTILTALAKKYGDFCNDKPAMDALAKSDEGNSALFGGQNVIAIYAASVEKADLSKASDYDQQICENFQNAFRGYFQGSKTAEKALDDFIKALAEATSLAAKDSADGKVKQQIFVSDKVTVSGDTITIAA